MTYSPFPGVLHLLLLLEQLSLQLFLVANQVLDLLLHLVLQLLDDVVDFAPVLLALLEDLQLRVQLFVLILQVFHLRQEADEQVNRKTHKRKKRKQ